MNAEWIEILKLHPEANFLQAPVWGKVNTLIGHKAIVKADLPEGGRTREEKSQGYWCQMIVKNAKRGRYLEIPGGPLVSWDNRTVVEAVFAEIRQVAEREKCVFVRLRPQLRSDDIAKLEGLGLKKAPMHLHAEHTVILDLTKTEEDLLKDLRRQTRYEVRRAERLGLKTTWSCEEADFAEFHKVQTATAERQHFVPPSLKTLLAEHEGFEDKARLYIARTNDGAPVAYGLILIDGVEAAYFEAASTELNYKLPGAYGLQWQVIRDLKALGIKRYNLWGIAPPGQVEHRYAGVTTFKRGFGGKVVEFVPAQDLVVDSLRYKFDFLVETMRRKRRKL